MPFIIKNNNGQRTVSIKKTTPDIFSMLEGLTIQCEFKITGVFYDQKERADKVGKVGQEVRQEEPEKKSEKPEKSVKSEKSDNSEKKSVKPERPDKPNKPEKTEKSEKTEQTEKKSEKLEKSQLSERLEKSQLSEKPEKSQLSEKPEKSQLSEKSEKLEKSNAEAAPVRKESFEETKKISKPIETQAAVAAGTVLKTLCLQVDKQDSKMVYITHNQDDLMRLCDAMLESQDLIEGLCPVTSVMAGDFVFAKSTDDDQWYRATVQKSNPSGVSVYFYDWGLYDDLEMNRIRKFTVPSLNLDKYPACALRLQIVETNFDLFEKFCSGEEVYDVKIIAYKETDKAYIAKILDLA